MIFRLFMTGDSFDISGYLSYLMVAFLAFAYHECAHAFVADWLGDPTPCAHGRLTLNPFPHIDPTGFILLAIFGFGWAYTPVNPSLMRGNPRQSHAIVSVAGPLANLLMALFFAVVYRVWGVFNMPPWVAQFITTGVWLNCLLMFFNLLPVPPLDGFSILIGVLPAEIAYQLIPLRQYGMYVFLFIFLLLPYMGINMFGWIFSYSLQVAGLLVGV